MWTMMLIIDHHDAHHCHPDDRIDHYHHVDPALKKKGNSRFEILFVLSNPQCPRRDGGNFAESPSLLFHKTGLETSFI